MIKDFLQQLELQSSIDTVMIRTQHTERTEKVLEGVTVVQADNGMISLKVNPSKVYASYILKDEEALNCYEVLKYSEFNAAMRYVLDELGIYAFYYKRIDYRFDSYTTTFDEVQKLNKALILSYYTLHHTENIYHTKHLITDEDLNDCYATYTRELESYRKIREEPTGTVLSRLEIRSINQHKTKNPFPLTRPEELASRWKAELTECPAAYTAMTETLNQALIERFNSNRALYPTISEFLRHNIDIIFTAKQMDDLLYQLGVKNPEQTRWNFQRRNKGLDTKFYSEKDLTAYIKYLAKRQKIFFSC